MWAQDTGAMQGYAGAAAAATTLPPFSEPPASTDSTGLSTQAAAVSQATNTAAGDVQSTVTTVQQTFSAIPNALSSLANPAAVGDALTPLQVLDLLGDLSSIFVDPEIGTAGVTLDGILAGAALPYDINGYFVGLHTDDIVSGWAGLETWPGTAFGPPEFVPGSQPRGLGGFGGSWRGEHGRSVIGAVGVDNGGPRRCALAAMSLPATSVGAAAEASSAGSVFSQMALAGMAGRAMAGTVGTGGGAGGVRARERGGVTKREAETNETTEEPATPLQVPAGGPITSIAAELRELASLRDAGILTQDEFTEQKRRLLPH